MERIPGAWEEDGLLVIRDKDGKRITVEKDKNAKAHAQLIA